MIDTLLSVRDLKAHFFLRDVVVKAVDGVSFDLGRGETLAIVGESGCGKSVTAMSILRLLPQPPARIVGGEIAFDGMDLVKISNRELLKVRGRRIAMIFQDPMTSLNPVFTVGSQIRESAQTHFSIGKREAKDRALRALGLAKLPDPETAYTSYPHQLSGGMRQRAMIAMALVCEPEILIADEPTTALDVTIQAQILDLLNELQSNLGMSIILITHDLGVVAEMADRVVVMYAGRKVEDGSVADVLGNPQHPYTLGLLNSSFALHQGDGVHKRKLSEIPGMVPSPYDLPDGCVFRPRCSYATATCQTSFPALRTIGGKQSVACFEAPLGN